MKLTEINLWEEFCEEGDCEERVDYIIEFDIYHKGEKKIYLCKHHLEELKEVLNDQRT